MLRFRTYRRTILYYLLALLVAGSLFLWPRPVHAAVVSNCGNDTELRTAIDSTPAGGTITFNCSGTIVTAYLYIDKNLTIDGAGQNIELKTYFGIFSVEANATLNLNKLTMRGANFLYHAIANAGTVNITNSTLSGNVGRSNSMGTAILNSGTVNITNSIFSYNSSGLGGAIYNTVGIINITNSIFTDNRSWGSGGAILNSGGTVNVTNTTFSNNTGAYGGVIYNYSGASYFTNTTFSNNSGDAGNGGVIYNHTGTVRVRASIVANSTGGNCSGSISDGGYNLEDANTCGFTQSSSLTNTNPLLDVLADNGGPTQTFALLPGSPALDHIPYGNCAVSTDQRGFPRPSGDGGCDIGAFEYQVPGWVFKPKPGHDPADLIAQFRVTPDHESSLDSTSEITFSFKVRNIGQGIATNLRVELPIDPALVVGYGSFDDPRVWITAVTADKVIISLPMLETNQEITGKVIFRPSDKAVTGTKIRLRYELRYDDPAGSGKVRVSNGQSFSFADSSRDVSGGAVQPLTPEVATLKVGDVLEVTGDFFLPDEIVSAWYTDSAGKSVALGIRIADTEGKVSLKLDSSGLAVGSYSVVLYGNRSEVSGNTILTLQ